VDREDIENEWLFARCREVQESPNGFLDLWAREHYKSTIITFGLTVQDILNNPETTVGLFSHTRPQAKGFLRQIKTEFERNAKLKEWFPDVLWADPQKESPKWSEDDGICVKRRGNPKEQTVEAWGLVDGQPTGKHYKLMVYDDVVTLESITTPEMIQKVTRAWELSRNLGSEGGAVRYIGTRYHYHDTYNEIMNRGAATSDGQVDGPPVLMSRERLAEKRKEMGPYTFGSQMLQDPKADEAQGFRADWVNYYPGANSGAGLNIYIVVDAANEKRKTSDYTSAWVIGLGSDKNYYVLDMVRDRLNLTERASMLFTLHKRWNPMGVGYERYGMMADVAHIRDKMDRENYHFSIVELGGPTPKNDRIRRLIPVFEGGHWWMPTRLYYTNYEKVSQNLVHTFLEEELKPFPVAAHDDMLDAAARILDEELRASWPAPVVEEPKVDRYRKKASGGRTWQSA
jgi:phage terminase large subunit-like protein